MDLFVVEQPEPHRHTLEITERWTAVLLSTIEGEIALGFFLDGELVCWTDHVIGET